MRFKRLLFLLFTLVCASVHAGNTFAIKTVVIDAGHGGKDPGATGPGKTNEKDVALSVALKLGDYIHSNFPDVTVIYTRKTDVFIELHERAEIANKNKADLFIAIHCNSTPTPAAYGTSTYVLGLHRTEANLEVAKRENAVILLEDDRDKNYEFDPNSPEGHIMMSMKQNAFLDQSIDIASKIEGQFEGGAKRKSLGVKQAGFYVLYKTAMPSILSEIGFISNPTEEKFLASEKGQEQIASSLFKAFKDYKFEMENSEGEQFAYEEAKRKSAANVDTTPKVKKDATTAGTTKTNPPVVKESVKPVAEKPEPTNTATTIDNNNGYVTTASGRKIRKPIDNASGGGIAPMAVKPQETPAAKTENKPAPVIEDKRIEVTQNSASNIEKNKPEPEVKKPVSQPKEVKTEVKEEPKVAEKIEPKEDKPVAEGKKVVAGNSGGAAEESKTVPAEKPVSKPVVAENKPVKTEPKPVEKAPVITKTEEKPAVTESKPVKTAPAEKPSSKPTVTENKPVKTEPKPVEKTPVAVKTEEKPVASKPVKKPAETESVSSGTMTFKVQLIALKGPMKASEVTKVTKVLGEISDESIPDKGLIRYYAGNSKTYSEAKRKAAIAAEVGYKDAFIVGFKDGKRYGPEKLKQYENQ